MRSFFLCQPAADPQWAKSKRIIFWSFRFLLLLCACGGIGLVSLYLAVGSYPLEFCDGYWEVPLLVALNILPVLALGLCFYGLTGRVPWTFGLTAAVTLGLSVGNYFKLTFRDDPLMFGDLLLLREAGNMSARYQPYWDTTMKVTALCVILGLAVLCLLTRGKLPLKLRLGTGGAGIVLLAALTPSLLSADVYNKTANYTYLDSQWSSTQQYIAHGFVYPFLHSISDSVETPPKGYNKGDAAALLGQYTDADIPEDKKVNVMGIMLEAYNDFTRFGVPELSTDVYAVWHQLEQEGYSGNLVTNIFGGGTVDTERCFLTGYSALANFRGRTNAYPWYFRQQGYTVEGVHPCYQWFYNRANINEYLGFPTYHFTENHFADIAQNGVVMDNDLFPELLRLYQKGTAGDTPYFNFSVTYQGHGPYADYACWWGERGDFVVDDGTYTDQQQFILDNYFGSIANTNENLKMLTDYFRSDDEPVVLVLFGDHNPWMMDGGALYTAMGIDLNQDTRAGFLNYYATRYIIWANDAAKQVLGNDFQGTGPDVSPCFLMTELFDLCGWEGPAYMQATREVAQEVPVIHTTGRYLVDGELISDLSGEQAALVRDYQNLQYYWRKNFSYGEE